MPVYEFECQECKHITEKVMDITMSDVQIAECEKCHLEAKKVVSKPQAVEPAWKPYYDENLGDEPVLIESREHRKKLLKAKGLEEVEFDSTKKKERKQKLEHFNREFKKKRAKLDPEWRKQNAS